MIRKQSPDTHCFRIHHGCLILRTMFFNAFHLHIKKILPGSFLPVQPMQISFQLHMIEMILAECLIKHNRHGIAKIQ